VTTKTENLTATAPLQPPAATAQPATSASTKDAAKHTEREYPQNPGHAVDGTRSTTYTIPACPPWCTRPSGHDYDSEDWSGAHRTGKAG
jgi:hypothetical protein